MTTRRARAAIALALVLAAAAVPARDAAAADLRDLAKRAEAEWRSAGAVVAGAPSRFLYEDDTISVRLPQLPAGRCTSVALLGARGMSFHAKVAGNGDEDEEDLGRSTSIGGMLQIGRGAPMSATVVHRPAGSCGTRTLIVSSS